MEIGLANLPGKERMPTWSVSCPMLSPLAAQIQVQKACMLDHEEVGGLRDKPDGADNDVLDDPQESDGSDASSEEEDVSDSDCLIDPAIAAGSLQPEPVPPLPPPPTPRRAHAEATEAHQFYWVTRSLRKATCSACGHDIPGRTYRVVFEPNPREVEDLRRWRAVFWRYYHIAKECLGHLTQPLPQGQLPLDIAPLPKESDDARAATTAAAVAQLRTEFAASRAASSGSGAAASSAASSSI